MGATTRMADRVAVTSDVVGTGPAALGAAKPGYQTFATALGNGSVYYGIVDDTTGEWENGEGTLSAGGATLTRDTVLSSSNGGAFVSFAVGTKTIACVEPAANKSLDMGSY